MGREIFLRNYRSTDLDAMFRLDEACFAEEFRFDRDSMLRFAEEPNAIVPVTEGSDGKIAGFVIAHVERSGLESMAYVVTLDVAPEFRRKGIAQRLMNETESQAAAVGARSIQLHVFIGNTGAIRFYERMGYQGIMVQRGFYGRAGLDAIVYLKELPSP